MTAAVESMAYAGDVPWHGLGVKVSDKLTPQQILVKANLDWTVSKHPIYRKVNGHEEIVPDRMELRRDSDNAHFDIVGKIWKPVQNEEAFDFFTKFVKEAKMSMETAGALWDGQIVWALARIKKDFTLGKDDVVQNYLLLASPHQANRALLSLHTSVRVVCWNTLTAALGGSWKEASKRKDIFRMPHSQEFNEGMKEKAAIALGLAIKQSEEFQEVAELLSKKRVKAETVEEFFCEVLQFDPKKAEKKKDGELKEPRMLEQFRQALIAAPGHNLSTSKGTLWGALNAVTYVVDHQLGKERDTALRTAWFGTRAGLKRRAVDLAIKQAK